MTETRLRKGLAPDLFSSFRVTLPTGYWAARRNSLLFANSDQEAEAYPD
jgi:hypothetical protein